MGFTFWRESAGDKVVEEKSGVCAFFYNGHFKNITFVQFSAFVIAPDSVWEIRDICRK